MCECGNVAAKRKHGEWICQRCLDLEIVQHRADSDNKKNKLTLNLDIDVYAK